MADYLDLYDYRRRVTALYRERNAGLQAGEDAEQVLIRFRAGRDALFEKHPQSALDEEQKSRFHGLPYFPYQPELRVKATLDTQVPAQRQTITMNAEEQMSMITVGHLSFTVQGQQVSLALYWLEIYGGGLFLPFRDTTCPEESYGGGRYLFDTIKGSDPEPGEDTTSSMLLDFNYAYNPSCAYNIRWVCPLAPQENRLAVAIPAGEKKYALEL